MTQEAFDQLVENSQAHEVFNLGWSSYRTLEFAETFLPAVQYIEDQGFSIYDGAALFDENQRTQNKVFGLNQDNTLIRLIAYTYPKGVPAVEGKNSINVGADETCIFMEVDQNDEVDVHFRFGRQFRIVLNDFLASESRGGPAVVENKTYKTNLSTFQNAFSEAVTHYDLMTFVLKTVGVDGIEARQESFKAYRDIFKELNDDFGAGFVKEKHPDAFGHGDIEAEALKNAGFTEEEIEIIYYGNWLRDFSQVIVDATVSFNIGDRKILERKYEHLDHVRESLLAMDNKLSPKTWIKVLRILAVKEFVYNFEKKKGETPNQNYAEHLAGFQTKYGGLDKDILGLYRPEEHLDNPKGLKDFSAFGDPELSEPIDFKYEFVIEEDGRQKITSEQRTLYVGTSEESLEINPDTLMKRYLLEDIDEKRPSCITYFADQMRLAKIKGKSKEGFIHFGAALHVLEDYFAHTNFIEIALIKCGFYKVFPWVELSKEVEDMTDGKEKANLIPVVTGLFGSDDSVASITPKIAEEFFSIEFDEYETVGYMERTFFDSLVLTILEDLSITQKNVPEKDRLEYAGYTVQDLYDLYNSYLEVRDKWAKLKETDYIGWLLTLIDKGGFFLGQALKVYTNILFNIILEGIEDGIRETQTRTNQNFGTDPTHTQIAKDDVHHPLNNLAGILAVAAVKDVGERMRACWHNNLPIEELITHTKETYFSHPRDVTWMDIIVKKWAIKNKLAVIRARSKTALHYHEEQTKKSLEGFEGFIKNISDYFNDK